MTKQIVLIFSLIKIAFSPIYKSNIRRLAWNIKFEKRRTFVIELNEELILITGHTFSMSEDKKKKKQKQFLLSNAFSVYTIWEY